MEDNKEPRYIDAKIHSIGEESLELYFSGMKTVSQIVSIKDITQGSFKIVEKDLVPGRWIKGKMWEPVSGVFIYADLEVYDRTPFSDDKRQDLRDMLRAQTYFQNNMWGGRV